MPSPPCSVAMIGTVYTVGMTSADRSRIEQLMRGQRRVLIDLRPLALMKANPKWTREVLDLRYNIVEQAHLPWWRRSVRYVWDERLTCTAAKLSEHGVARPTITRLAGDLLVGRDIILLCACRDESRCRRIMVAKAVQDALVARYLDTGEESRPCQTSRRTPFCMGTR